MSGCDCENVHSEKLTMAFSLRQCKSWSLKLCVMIISIELPDSTPVSLILTKFPRSQGYQKSETLNCILLIRKVNV